MAEVFSAPARERLSKKCELLQAKILGKFDGNNSLPQLETGTSFSLQNAVELIFKNDKTLLNLLTEPKGTGALTFEQNVGNIIQEEEPQEEVKSPQQETSSVDKQVAMKQKLLDQAKAAAEAAQNVVDDDDEDLEDLLDDLI